MMLTKTKISGVAVGSAVIFGGTPNSAVGDMELCARPNTPSMMTELDRRGETTVEPLPMRLQVDVELGNLRWTAGDSRKLQSLAAKRALLTASRDEEREFEHLQDRRRSVLASATGTDALQEFRRRRFVNELLRVLNRNATFFTAKDQKKLRAIAKTARS
jgi:hypothetical protein